MKSIVCASVEKVLDGATSGPSNPLKQLTLQLKKYDSVLESVSSASRYASSPSPESEPSKFVTFSSIEGTLSVLEEVFPASRLPTLEFSCRLTSGILPGGS